MKKGPEPQGNGAVPSPESDPRDQLMRRLVQVENWVSSPAKRPGADARSKLQSVFEAADDLNFAFASLPKGSFGVNETHVSERIRRLLDFCAVITDHPVELEYTSTFAQLSGGEEPDFLSHKEMSVAEKLSEEEETAARGHRAS